MYDFKRTPPNFSYFLIFWASLSQVWLLIFHLHQRQAETGSLQSLEFLISRVQSLVFISETALKLALEKESLHGHSKPYMCGSILSYTNAQLERCWTDSRPQGGLFSGEIGNYVPDGFLLFHYKLSSQFTKTYLEESKSPSFINQIMSAEQNKGKGSGWQCESDKRKYRQWKLDRCCGI